jgi:hypothetical protein
MELECPVCQVESELDDIALPSKACDDNEWECPACSATMSIGWCAVAEVRSKPVPFK